MGEDTALFLAAGIGEPDEPETSELISAAPGAPVKKTKVLGPLPISPTDYVREIQNYFLKTDPKTGTFVTSKKQAESLGLKWGQANKFTGYVYPNNLGNPDAILRLLKYFEEIDKETKALSKSRPSDYFKDKAFWIWATLAGPLAAFYVFDPVGPTKAALQADLAKWENRRDTYEALTEEWKSAADDPAEFTPERKVYFDKAALPLILGLWPDRPGLSVLDAATPMILAKQVAIAREAMKQAWDELNSSLTVGAFDPPGLGIPAWVGYIAGALGAGILAILGFQAYSTSVTAKAIRARLKG